MKTVIYLVRHAHSNYSKDELNRPISEKGRDSVSHLTELFMEKKIDHIYSSPYKRAIETIEDYALKQNLNIHIVDAFKERQMGDFDGPFLDALVYVWNHPPFAYPNGESNEVAQNRGIQELMNLLKMHQGEHIIISTHGNLLTLLMQYFDKQYDISFWQSLSMPDIYELIFENHTLQAVNRIWDK